jgi:SPP1 family predicted phage head-tail adaptor
MPGTDPTIGAGDLDGLVTLLAPQYNQYEDEITGWAPVTKIWAAIAPVFSMEVSEASRDVEVVTMTVRIRYRTDIDARWRIQDGAHTYQVNGIQNVAGRNITLLLQCREVV